MKPIDADALKAKINTVFFSEIEKIIDEAPTVNGWIPVGEELPKDPSPVLVTILWHEPYDNYEVSIEEYWGNGDGWGDWGNAEIVAWMPLPEPHKRDDEA